MRLASCMLRSKIWLPGSSENLEEMWKAMVLEVSALRGPMALAMEVASLAKTLSAGGAASEP